MSEVRRERRLDVITPNLQRFDADKAADWLDAIKRQVCPFCGEGPFTVVASHVRWRHGLNRRELRELLCVPARESICDPSYAKLMGDNSRARGSGGSLPRLGNYTVTSAVKAYAERRRRLHACAACGKDVRDRHRKTCGNPSCVVLARAATRSANERQT
jgi:ribosomal protein L37AE/L43A